MLLKNRRHKGAEAHRMAPLLPRLAVGLAIFFWAPCHCEAFATPSIRFPRGFVGASAAASVLRARNSFAEEEFPTTPQAATLFCHKSRRENLQDVLRFAAGGMTGTVGFLLLPALAAEDAVVLRLISDQQSAGLQLKEITTNSGKTAVIIERIVFRNDLNQDLQPGMILQGPYSNAQSVVARIRGGPFPLELTFATNPSYVYVAPPQPKEMPSSNDFVKRVLSSPSECHVKARRDDVVEINYEAYYLKPSAPAANFNLDTDAILYDSSAQRGTGLPYQMVLGSGDMIPGVDQGVFNMCLGEIRQLEIPPQLGYGPKSRQLYGIPDGAKLVWKVEVATVNSMTQYE